MHNRLIPEQTTSKKIATLIAISDFFKVHMLMRIPGSLWADQGFASHQAGNIARGLVQML